MFANKYLQISIFPLISHKNKAIRMCLMFAAKECGMASIARKGCSLFEKGCASIALWGATQNQIATETSNLVFYICIMHRYYLKLFKKICQKLCVQGRTKEF